MSANEAGLDDLHDPRLWRALEHAPDQGAAPDWRVRKEILKQAHAAIGEPDPEDAEADLERAAQSWWQRLGGERQSNPRRRWPAAVAVVMVALVAVMLWRRVPAPTPPALDDRTSVAVNSPKAEEPAVASSVPRPPPADSASVPLLPPSFFKTPELPPAEPVPAPEPAPPIKATAAGPVSPPPRSESAQTPPAPPPAPSQVAPPQKAQKTPLPPAPPPLPAALPPQEQREAVASAKPVPTAAPAPAAPSSVRTDETEPPTFEALARWNRITIAKRGGATRTLERPEARDVSGLMASAALSAVGPQPFKGAAEYRVTLERGAEVLAVFEISGPQVRWREGKTPAATGRPSEGSISALREALGRAVEEPQAVAGEPPRSP